MRTNGELLKNLGNFVNRTLMFVAKFYDGVVPAPHAEKGRAEVAELGASVSAKVRPALLCVLSCVSRVCTLCARATTNTAPFHVRMHHNRHHHHCSNHIPINKQKNQHNASPKVAEYVQAMEARRLRAGIATAMAVSADANKFFTDTAVFRVGNSRGRRL